MCHIRVWFVQFQATKRFYGRHLTLKLESHISKIYEKYQLLSTRLSGTELTAQEISSVGKQIGGIEELAMTYGRWKKAKSNMDELCRMFSEDADTVLKELAGEEIQREEHIVEELERQLRHCLLAPEPEENGNAVMEIRSGTGGDEAAMFAGEMLRMYERYCALRGWTFSIVSASEEQGDAIREAMISIEGEGVFRRLKYESGVHRVQRIPKTDSQGRVHTSTITVALLPQSTDVVVDIAEKDLRIEFFKSSGPGGQHVNKTNSAVRITHLPTGTAIAVQEERCAQQNRARAMEMLRIKLYDRQRSVQDATRKSSRQSQIGQAERSDKIRTYNFPQARITDHRLGVSIHGLETFFAGKALDQFIDQMVLKEEEDRISELEQL